VLRTSIALGIGLTQDRTAVQYSESRLAGSNVCCTVVRDGPEDRRRSTTSMCAAARSSRARRRERRLSASAPERHSRRMPAGAITVPGARTRSRWRWRCRRRRRRGRRGRLASETRCARTRIRSRLCTPMSPSASPERLAEGEPGPAIRVDAVRGRAGSARRHTREIGRMRPPRGARRAGPKLARDVSTGRRPRCIDREGGGG
jgi:hypothetical protein